MRSVKCKLCNRVIAVLQNLCIKGKPVLCYWPLIWVTINTRHLTVLFCKQKYFNSFQVRHLSEDIGFVLLGCPLYWSPAVKDVQFYNVHDPVGQIMWCNSPERWNTEGSVGRGITAVSGINWRISGNCYN